MKKSRDLWKGRLIGVHCSTAGGLFTAIARGQAVGCTAIQLFTKNNNRWIAPPLSVSEVEAFQSAWRASGIRVVMAHTAYLVNLASADPVVTERSMESMRLELHNAIAAGIPYVVVHPGAHRGDGEMIAIRRIAERINILLEETVGGQVCVLLEGTAGQGSSIGHRFEHLRDILTNIRYGDRIGVCLDTAHLFAAGYDFRAPKTYAAMWDRFDAVVGRRWLKALHLNDTTRGLGSRVDRHAHLGRGQIGAAGFRLLMRDPRLRTIPMVLETPKGKTDALDRKNLDLLRGWMRR